MKRILIIVLTIVCGVACTDSYAKKPTKHHEQQTLDSLRLAEELKQLEFEMQMKEELHHAKLEELRSKAEVINGDSALPCQEDAQSNDDYYAALGISNEQPNASFAIQEAMMQAQIELSKQVGDEKIALNNVEKVCQRISQKPNGTFIAYMALRMPKKQ